MNHIEITIPTTDAALQETLIALLSEIEYEGFEENADSLKAYINEADFNEIILDEILKQFELTYSKSVINKQNWNEVWESNFEPVIVDDFVGIRADFHQSIVGVKHELLITPKMSFGTGHHATTFSVIRLMQNVDFQQKNVFDFGTGTGILAILAEKLGAKAVLAVDNDDWCVENSLENVEKNNCQNIEIQKVNDANSDKKFDIIIANINKNIILDNLAFLADDVVKDGDIILSGLLIEDEADIIAATKKIGWQHVTTISKGVWIAMLLKN